MDIRLNKRGNQDDFETEIGADFCQNTKPANTKINIKLNQPLI